MNAWTDPRNQLVDDVTLCLHGTSKVVLQRKRLLVSRSSSHQVGSHIGARYANPADIKKGEKGTINFDIGDYLFTPPTSIGTIIISCNQATKQRRKRSWRSLVPAPQCAAIEYHACIDPVSRDAPTIPAIEDPRNPPFPQSVRQNR